MPHEITPCHYAFIINPQSGQRYDVNLAARISQRFQNNPYGHTAETIQTLAKGHATELAAELAADYGSRLIAIACGGDGTAQEVANGIVNTPAAMGLLPIGTANDFARAALSGTDPEELLQKMIEPDIRPIDVIQADGTICLNIASFGFDTKVQRQAASLNARFRWLGTLSYPIAIALCLLGNREFPMHYQLQTIDPEGQTKTVEADARFILAAICNGRYYGGGFNPAPQASLEDGKLDFCLVDNLPLRRILPLIPLYKQGRHLSDPAVHSWQVTSGRIEAPGSLLLGNLDGEIFEKESVDFKVLPKALRFAFY